MDLFGRKRRGVERKERERRREIAYQNAISVAQSESGGIYPHSSSYVAPDDGIGGLFQHQPYSGFEAPTTSSCDSGSGYDSSPSSSDSGPSSCGGE